MDDDDLRPTEWFRPGQVEKEKAAAGTYNDTDDGVVEAWLHGSWHDVPSMALAGASSWLPYSWPPADHTGRLKLTPTPRHRLSLPPCRPCFTHR